MNSLNKTFLPTKNYKNRNWFIIDCKGQKLGRLATIIVALLKGKIKPHYYPSIDIGDYIILINADSIIINEDSKHYIVNKSRTTWSFFKNKKCSRLSSKINN
jgi:ribosomal protein L13